VEHFDLAVNGVLSGGRQGAHDAKLNGDMFNIRIAWDAVRVFAGY